MDLKDQLQNLFPDHLPNDEPEKVGKKRVWIQEDPIICKYEKRKGKPITILEGYNGSANDVKQLAKDLKKKLSVGGGIKGETIIIQGNYRDKIMELLKEMGFNVKRVGG